jgi:hypothetical protein
MTWNWNTKKTSGVMTDRVPQFLKRFAAEHNKFGI